VKLLRMHTMVRALALVLAVPAGDALGEQSAKELVGSWTLVSVAVNQDGQKIEPFGTNPKGSLIFDRNGRFLIMVTRSDLPKFGSNNREAGTPEENQAVVRGSVAYFGTYTVREEERLLVLHVEGSTFANWVGTDQKRIFTIARDELRYTNSNRSTGGGPALVVWKRVK
jgi:hypothetical protein